MYLLFFPDDQLIILHVLALVLREVPTSHLQTRLGNLSDPRNRNHKSLAIGNHNFEIASFSRRNRSKIAVSQSQQSHWAGCFLSRSDFFELRLQSLAICDFEVAAIRVTKLETAACWLTNCPRKDHCPNRRASILLLGRNKVLCLGTERVQAQRLVGCRRHYWLSGLDGLSQLSSKRRTNVQQLTCKIDLSSSFYYLFFSFVLIELKPFVLKGKVLGEKFWKSAKQC